MLLSLTKPFGADYAKGAEITDDKSNDMNRIRKTIMVALMMCLCLMVQAQTTVQSQSDLGIFRFPLFERAVRCIKFYEGWHDIKRNYPYIGWGHCVQPHENFKKNLTLEQADSLLRSDLRTFCGMFRKYGKDSLLLAVLAYNVGQYKVLGDRRKFRKSRLLQKIERGERDIEREYLDFCRWKGKVIASIRRRRNTELRLLYEP